MDREPTLTAVLDQLPVFPLPETVLFPGIVLPLHIFEERYRDLITDALASHRCLAVAMVAPGTDGNSRPPLCDVGCAGRIIHAERLTGGRYNILVHGLQRVRLVEELPLPRSYRCFRAEVIPPPNEQSVQAARGELAKLQSCVLNLCSAVADTDQQLVEVLRSTSDPIELVDIICAVLVSEPARQQRLLATIDLRSRLSEVIETLADVMVRLGTPPGSAKMN